MLKNLSPLHFSLPPTSQRRRQLLAVDICSAVHQGLQSTVKMRVDPASAAEGSCKASNASQTSKKTASSELLAEWVREGQSEIELLIRCQGL